MTRSNPFLRLEFCSTLDLLDLVQSVTDQAGRLVGLDDDAIHWVSVAVRESVINAVKHGNRDDRSKRVFVEFYPDTTCEPPCLTVSVRDEGEGFDVEEVDDPLSPENMLKSQGRGVFLIRSFMDEVTIQRMPEGGMEVRMLKRAVPSS